MSQPVTVSLSPVLAPPLPRSLGSISFVCGTQNALALVAQTANLVWCIAPGTSISSWRQNRAGLPACLDCLDRLLHLPAMKWTMLLTAGMALPQNWLYEISPVFVSCLTIVSSLWYLELLNVSLCELPLSVSLSLSIYLSLPIAATSYYKPWGETKANCCLCVYRERRVRNCSI